jgi:OOP family OmpA-OmpF porin
MKSIKLHFALLCAVVTVLAAPNATAAQSDEGWYVGGSIGQGRASNGSGDVVTSLAVVGITGTGTTSTNKTAGKIFLGYQFNENIALEGGYFNLGTYSANGTTTAPAASTFSVSSKLQGANIDAVGILPFGQGVSGIGRVGVAYISSSTDVAFSNPAVGSRYGSPSNNKSVAEVGLGLQYQFTPTISGRLEWQRLLDVVNLNSVTTNIDFYSIGITMRF